MSSFNIQLDILYFLVFMLGASLASFIAVYDERKNVKGNSICINCKKKLKFFELIPVFSYIFLGGKCKNCKTKIPINLLLYEILLGTWFLFTVYNAYSITNLLLQLVLGCIFLILIIEDMDEMQVSSNFLYLFVSICILKALLTFILPGPFANNVYELFVPILIFSLFWIIYFINKNAIGEADPYIFTGLGLFFGIQFSVSLFLYSVWGGAIYGIFYLVFINKKIERGVRVPFLPIIFCAALFVIIFNFHIIKIQDILLINEILFQS